MSNFSSFSELCSILFLFSIALQICATVAWTTSTGRCSQFPVTRNGKSLSLPSAVFFLFLGPLGIGLVEWRPYLIVVMWSGACSTGCRINAFSSSSQAVINPRQTPRLWIMKSGSSLRVPRRGFGHMGFALMWGAVWWKFHKLGRSVLVFVGQNPSALGELQQQKWLYFVSLCKNIWMNMYATFSCLLLSWMNPR